MNQINSTITSIDWNNNCILSCEDHLIFTDGEKSLSKLVNWCKQLENLYQSNLAMPFIKEAQVSAQEFFALISLGLYKSSAVSLRTIIESFLYFSYFKDHPIELNSLVSNKSFYMSKQDILLYHNTHSNNFPEIARQIGLTSKLEETYKKASIIIHGQIPGTWHSSDNLIDRKYCSQLATEAISDFIQTIDIINLLTLITISDEEWRNINHHAKRIFLHKIPMEKKKCMNRY